MVVEDKGFIAQAIEKEVKRRVEAAIAEEAAKVAERVSQIFSKEADQIAISVLKYYEIRKLHDDIVITVRKPEQ